MRVWLLLTAALFAAAAQAHSFGQSYALPIPLWMYLYGASAALLLSFLVIGFVVTARSAERKQQRHCVLEVDDRSAAWRRLVMLLQVLGVAALSLCIVCGLVGTQLPNDNLNMTLFWIAFVLGLAYLSALVGNVYARLNPWRALIDWSSRSEHSKLWRGRINYPQWLGCYPALLLYGVFIWLELFSRITPRLLSWVLIDYSLINLVGAWLIGRDAWFRHCEFFGIYFGLLSKIAPLDYVPAGPRWRVELRQPFIGLLDEAPDHFSLLLFVLFMLSSTAFDGLHETEPWVRGFWVNVYGLLTPFTGNNIVETYALYQWLYRLYQSLGLLLSPLIYLAIYLVFLRVASALTRQRMALAEMAVRFAYSLIPIALVYNIAHYYALFVAQGPQLLRLISDPLGRGWNLFGTADWLQQPLLVSMGALWHIQVGLILFGHIVSVYLMHAEALRLFALQRRALLSQLPMLLLMLAYTTIGLWILSLPITSQSGPG